MGGTSRANGFAQRREPARITRRHAPRRVELISSTRLVLAAKEMREACYWIELVCTARLVACDAIALLVEGRELAAILRASARTARSRASSTRP